MHRCVKDKNILHRGVPVSEQLHSQRRCGNLFSTDEVLHAHNLADVRTKILATGVWTRRIFNVRQILAESLLVGGNLDVKARVSRKPPSKKAYVHESSFWLLVSR